DLITLASAFILSYLLRFDFSFPENQSRAILLQLVYVLILQFSMLLWTGIHSFIWRYVGLSEVRAFIKAAIGSALILAALRIWLPEDLQPFRIPLSIIVVDTILAF